MGMFCARNKILQSTVWKINRRLTRQKSQTPPDDVSSFSSSRPNVVPNQVFDTNINYLYQLEKSFRTSFRKSTGFPADEITDGIRFKLEKRMLFYLDYLTKKIRTEEAYIIAFVSESDLNSGKQKDALQQMKYRMQVHSPAYIVIDIDYFPQAADFFGIEKIPTISIWMHQEEFVKIEGYQTTENLISLCDSIQQTVQFKALSNRMKSENSKNRKREKPKLDPLDI